MMMLVMLLAGTGRAQVQQDSAVFVHHWYIQPMIGAGLHIGEGSFADLISPAAQLSIGYQLTPVWGLQLSAAGWESRNGISVSTYSKYKWNYVQGTVDLTLSLTDLIGGYNPQRRLGAYAFVGGGAALGWHNNEAQALNATYLGFDKLWDGSRLFLTARGGLGLSYKVSNRVSVNLEGTALMLPDRFDSKSGRHSSRDWQVNLLAGVRINLGKSVKYVKRYVAPKPVEPKPEPVAKPKPEPVVAPTPKPEPVVEEPKGPYVVEVYFKRNGVRLSETEKEKLDELVAYMEEHTQSTVTITGYADKQTGSAQYNMTISRQRATEVLCYLTNKGIAKERVKAIYRGDKEQPKATPAENRIAICVTE